MSADYERGPFDGVAVAQRWMTLDLWAALHLPNRVSEFDQWYDEVGFADAWSHLLAMVRDLI